MKRIFIVAITLIFALSLYGCKKGEKKMSHGGHGKAESKIVLVDNLQVAFDLMPLANYMKMMKVMKIQEKLPANVNRSLLLTIISKKDMKLVKNAKVSFVIKDKNKKTQTKEAKVLAGGGMHHYGLLLDLTGMSHLDVTANIDVNGKSHKAKAQFHLH